MCGVTTLTRSGERGHIAVWIAGNIVENEGGGFSEPSPLWSERLGLSGRADAVEIESNHVAPVEYKSGVPHGTAADLQLCAQALCLEEMLGVSVPAGYVWYAGHRRKVEIAFTTALRLEVCHVIEQIREQLRTAVLPVAPNDSRCRQCQLQSHCLPGMANSAGRLSRYMTDVVYA